MKSTESETAHCQVEIKWLASNRETETDESLLFLTTMDSECPISPVLLIITLKLR